MDNPETFKGNIEHKTENEDTKKTTKQKKTKQTQHRKLKR
jgi:hypothetical protein